MTLTGACFSVMFACNEPYGELRTGYEPKFIDVTSVQSDYTAYSGSSRLLYTCPEEVTGSCNQAWCSVTKIREGEFELSLETNKGIVSRNAMVTLRAAGGAAVQIPISQRGILLRLSKSSATIPHTGGTVTVEVDSPIEFEHYASADWITYSVAGNTVTIDLPAHIGFPRIGFIYIVLPDQKISQFITVEQLGNLKGMELAKKFIGPEGSETVWYLDPDADNGPDFISAWVLENSNYKHNELKIGRFNVFSTFLQCMRLNVTYKDKTYNTGWKIAMTEGETDDEVVFTLEFVVDGWFWSNDTYFYNYGGMKSFLQNLTGLTTGDSKVYRAVHTDDIDNPTVMTLRDSGNSNNWFTVTKTPVAL